MAMYRRTIPSMTRHATATAAATSDAVAITRRPPLRATTRGVTRSTGAGSKRVRLSISSPASGRWPTLCGDALDAVRGVRLARPGAEGGPLSQRAERVDAEQEQRGGA